MKCKPTKSLLIASAMFATDVVAQPKAKEGRPYFVLEHFAGLVTNEVQECFKVLIPEELSAEGYKVRIEDNTDKITERYIRSLRDINKLCVQRVRQDVAAGLYPKDHSVNKGFIAQGD